MQENTPDFPAFHATLALMKRLEIFFGVLRVPLDAAAFSAAVLLAYWLRTRSIDLIPGIQLLEPPTTLPALHAYIADFVVPGLIAFIGIVAALGLYRITAVGRVWSELWRTVLGALLWIAFVIAWYFLVRKQLFYSRILLLHAVVLIALFASLFRTILVLIQRALLSWGFGARLVLTVGRHAPSDGARRTLEQDVRYAYRGHVASLADVQRALSRKQIDLIIQTDANPDSDDTSELIDFCRSRHIGYAFLPPVFADVPHLLTISRLGLLPLLQFRPTPLDGWGRVWKSCFDMLTSIVLLVLLLPLFIIIGAAIVLESGFPIFYVSKRMGERGMGHIPVVKFRSMIRDADARKSDIAAANHRRDGPLFKVKNDPRVTRVGSVLRRWSLDELPQLFNVLVGQMALVGPRPHLPEEVARYTSYQHRVFAVRPGITGLAQISGRSDLSFHDEVAFDLRYIEEWSPLLDIWILWRTMMVVIGHKGAD